MELREMEQDKMMAFRKRLVVTGWAFNLFFCLIRLAFFIPYAFTSSTIERIPVLVVLAVIGTMTQPL
jgi:hypothetical protein